MQIIKDFKKLKNSQMQKKIKKKTKHQNYRYLLSQPSQSENHNNEVSNKTWNRSLLAMNIWLVTLKMNLSSNLKLQEKTIKAKNYTFIWIQL